MSGQGLFTWPDGRKYSGQYEEDKKEGFGIFTWPDGQSYAGHWIDGKQSGKGKITKKNGNVKFGIWLEGKRIRWITETELESSVNSQNDDTGGEEEDENKIE